MGPGDERNNQFISNSRLTKIRTGLGEEQKWINERVKYDRRGAKKHILQK